MARYRAKSDGFVNGSRVRTGQEFDWGGKPGKWMESVATPVKAVKEKPVKAAKAKKTPPDTAGGETGGELV